MDGFSKNINSYKRIKKLYDQLILESNNKQNQIEELNELIKELEINRNSIKKQITFINKLINRTKYNTLEIRYEELEKKIQDNKKELNRIKIEKELIDNEITKNNTLIQDVASKIREYEYQEEILHKLNKKLEETVKVKTIDEILNDRLYLIRKTEKDINSLDEKKVLTQIDIIQMYKNYYINNINNDNPVSSFILEFGINYDVNDNKFYLINNNEFLLYFQKKTVINDITIERLNKILNQNEEL